MAAVKQQQQQQQQSGVSSGHFNPVRFSPPRKLLDMAAHESLLIRLGLWNFLNLDFDDSVQTDLIEELVVSYKYYPRKYTGESRVHGLSISLNRTVVANALRLPLERVAKGGGFPVSKEEGSFLEEVIRGFLVLRDDGEDASSVMSQRYIVSREMRFDWAGLVWFMMERELLKGKNLANCHYAPHLQLVLKHQRPELFNELGDGGDHGGSTDEDHHQPELEFKYETERNRGSLDDFSGNAMKYKYQEVEVDGTVDFLVTLEAHDEVVKKDYADGLDSQEIENQYNPELELKSATEMNGGGVADAAGDEMDCQEVDLNSAEHNAGRKVEFGSFVDLLVAQEAHLGLSREKSGNKQKKVDIVDENLDVETELRLVQTDKEDDAMVALVNQASEGKIHDLLGKNKEQKMHKVQDDVCPEKYDASETGMKPLLVASDEGPDKMETDHAPETQDILGEVDEHTSVEKAPPVQGKEVGNASKAPVSLGHFASETDIGASDERGGGLDLVLCAEQINLWAARLKNLARRKVEVALQKIEEQNQLIQQYEIALQNERQQKYQYESMLQKEREQKQNSDHRYERELHGMSSLLEDYKKAMKSTETKFAKYRERAQLPEEPLYMPHPDGGGNVILVSEWKALEEERQRQRLQAMVDDIEAEWKSNMEEQLGILDVYCDRLGDLEHDVRRLGGRL